MAHPNKLITDISNICKYTKIDRYTNKKIESKVWDFECLCKFICRMRCDQKWGKGVAFYLKTFSKAGHL